MTTETVATAPVAPAEKLEPRFTATRNIRGVDDATRDLLFADAVDFISYGVRSGVVILRTQRGFTLCEPREIHGQKLVFFDHCPADGSPRNVFWVDENTAGIISTRLHVRRELRDDFLGILADANA
jgi:hypothetical protein